ncbi:PREDICTED: dual specificity protein kinase TTK [Thamnophis sirtalis]|uniref:Dual specificity protein kinase TTK n=1 Tax=Thamnophis sirtalis TaxID=35019 RepID=A0A6I9YB18_9SAUR|nr:PREDICTED: dual specificity protein kinase TTK [Thamnophis sirtalis]
MQEDDLSEKGLFVASIMSRVRDLKNKCKHEDNVTDELNFTKVSTDTTDNSGTVNQIMMTANNPEDWLSFLLKMEKRGTFQTDTSLLNRLIGRYSQAVVALSAEKYSQNENYAHILVRFAELKAIEEPEDARDQFHLARLNCKKFAFVHVAFAQFELSQGNIKKAKQLLEKGVESRAVPAEMLEIALRNLYLQKTQLLSVEEKENLSGPDLHNITGNLQNKKKNTDFNEITTSIPSFFQGEKNDSSREAELVFGGRKPLTQLNKSNQKCMFGRVPLQLTNESESNTNESLKVEIPTVVKRQTSGTNLIQLLQPESNPNQSGPYLPRDLKPLPVRNLIHSDEENSEVAMNSTLTLKEKNDPVYVKKRETEILQEEPRIIESACLEGQQQPLLSLGSYQKEQEQFKLNCLASKNNWPHLEAQYKRNSEGKNSSFEHAAFPVPKRCSPSEQVSCIISPETASDRKSQAFVGGTPRNSMVHDYVACTPVVRNNFLSMDKATTPYNQLSYLQHCTPTAPFHLQSGFQVSASVLPSECILVKRKLYSVLKQIGRGGSSKVFQVLDEKKQLFAIKHVNLEEADQQTIESYKNEIAHLNKLQQHSDKIIRLYDYEINEKNIYMVMECGNIDLNSWLKKKKTINPWERKSYWKNMLEAVHTIHQHGIVHSDLKPANFLLVDGMLKLIDFGIANQMQPDVTSIVKDSQVGTINYMPPESIKDMSASAENGKSRSKISPKSDVWSLGCILYSMTYGKTPFQNITNYITKLHAIIDPNYEIMFPDIAEKDLLDVLKNCLIRNPKQRISISELLIHPYVHLQSNSQTGHQNAKGTSEEMKRILGQLIGLNSPNSISKAARTLYEQCNKGEGLDVSAFSKSDSRTTWKTK